MKEALTSFILQNMKNESTNLIVLELPIELKKIIDDFKNQSFKALGNYSYKTFYSCLMIGTTEINSFPKNISCPNFKIKINPTLKCKNKLNFFSVEENQFFENITKPLICLNKKINDNFYFPLNKIIQSDIFPCIYTNSNIDDNNLFSIDMKNEMEISDFRLKIIKMSFSNEGVIWKDLDYIHLLKDKDEKFCSSHN